MKALLAWLDQRCGILGGVRRFLDEPLRGGPSWWYVGHTLVLFGFLLQVITGFFLFSGYSSSTQTAWESVYHLQYQTPGGWLLRGLHVFGAQIFVVVVVLQVAVTVVRRAYLAPRELNWFLLLALVPLAIGLSATGWFLPQDQRGYWAAKVPINILGVLPILGPKLQTVAMGGSEFSHLTITRFVALHTWLLPSITGCVLAFYFVLTHRHGRSLSAPEVKVTGVYWPDQALKDAVACLVLACAALLIASQVGLPHGGEAAGAGRGPELGAPADPTEEYAAARPEWFMLFLFQFLKLFPGKTEVIGAIIVPTLAMGTLALMPWIARWKRGLVFNLGFACAIALGAALLTLRALTLDMGSADHQAAVRRARLDGERSRELAGSPRGIPPEGALAMVRQDPLLQGGKLFAQHCASCHRHGGLDGRDRVPGDAASASDLKQFASREWLSGLLDPSKIGTTNYFGGTKFKNGKMVRFVTKDVAGFDTAQKEDLKKVVLALSAEAALPIQKDADARDLAAIAEGRKLLASKTMRCTECHKFHSDDEDATAPDLTGYGSNSWLAAFLNDPAHARFYGKRNDRMSAYGREGRLDESQLRLIADWLRADWYRPGRAP